MRERAEMTKKLIQDMESNRQSQEFLMDSNDKDKPLPSLLRGRSPLP